jgi:O-succinylbenzoic acid--CoA ligase
MKNFGLQLKNFFLTWEKLKNNDFKWHLLEENEKNIVVFCQQYFDKTITFFELQTSGSTGIPKKIIIQKKNMQISAKATIDFLNLTQEDNFLICLPTDFIAGKMMLVRAMELETNVFFVSPQQDFWNEIINFQFVAIVPPQLRTLLDNPNANQILNTAKAIIVGGASVPVQWEKDLQKIKTPIYATYGMTETVSHIALQLLNTSQKQDFFEILPHITIEKDEDECLKIKSEITENQWIKTNDLVEIKEQTKFKWLGRKDNIINIGGKKIQPENIEKIIQEVFFILDIENLFFVYKIPNEKWENKLILIVEGKEWNEILKRQFYQILTNKIEKFLLPEKIIFLPQFIYTPTQKIQRKETFEKIKLL